MTAWSWGAAGGLRVVWQNATGPQTEPACSSAIRWELLLAASPQRAPHLAPPSLSRLSLDTLEPDRERASCYHDGGAGNDLGVCMAMGRGAAGVVGGGGVVCPAADGRKDAHGVVMPFAELSDGEGDGFDSNEGFDAALGGDSSQQHALFRWVGNQSDEWRTEAVHVWTCCLHALATCHQLIQWRNATEQRTQGLELPAVPFACSQVAAVRRGPCRGGCGWVWG
jgi:hypothetical protein